LKTPPSLSRVGSNRGRKCAEFFLNDTIDLFFLILLTAFWQFQTTTVSECCLTKKLLLPYILFEKKLQLRFRVGNGQHGGTGTVPTVSAHVRWLYSVCRHAVAGAALQAARAPFQAPDLSKYLTICRKIFFNSTGESRARRAIFRWGR